MAWNEPGDNKKDPWKGGGQQPPDLDQMFKNLQSKLSGLFGGGGKKDSDSGGLGGIFAILSIIGLLWLGFESFNVIDEGRRGVVLRFGSFDRMLQPGLRFRWPRPVEDVTIVDVGRVRGQQAGGNMLTQDENIISVNFDVQYQISDAEKYLFRLDRPNETLGKAAESAIRDVVGGQDMDYVLLEGRSDIAQRSTQLLQSILDKYDIGLQVVKINLTDIRPPQQVKEAFDDAIKAREDKERLQNEAEAYANAKIPLARGNASRQLEEAQGYKESTIARATGESKRFSLLEEIYKGHPQVTRKRLYLEAMESVLSSSTKMLLDAEGGNTMMYLPLDKIINSSMNQYTIPETSIRLPDTGTVAPRETRRGDSRRRGERR